MARGFTLVELVVTLAVIGILAGIGLPAWRSFEHDARLQALVGGYLHAFNTARATAVTVQRNVSLCPVDRQGNCANHWQARLALFYDDDRDGRPAADGDVIEHLEVRGAAGARVTLRAFGSTRHVTLRRSGHYRQNGTFRFCLPDDPRGRAIIINVSGRARTETIHCPP